MKGDILLKLSRHLIYIIKKDKKDFIRYNLKEKSMQRLWRGKKGSWYNVTTQYAFFRDYYMNDLKADERFGKLLKMVREDNDNCSNISTFFDRLEPYLIYENYIQEGINFKPDKSWRWNGGRDVTHLTKQVSKYDKNTRNLLRATEFTVTPDFEECYFHEKDGTLFKKVMQLLHGMTEITDNEKSQLLNSVTSSNYRLVRLCNEHNYDPKALFGYIVNYLKPFENINVTEGFQLIDDYYNMCAEIGRKAKKYPKYIKSMHDIIKANYDTYKREFPEELFLEKQNLTLEWKNKEFCIVTPKISKDIVSEGTDLNHCVSSYVDKIIDGKTMIIFLRRTKSPTESLVTLEMNKNELTQARGAYNRKLEEPEVKALQEWSKARRIELLVYGES